MELTKDEQSFRRTFTEASKREPAYFPTLTGMSDRKIRFAVICRMKVFDTITNFASYILAKHDNPKELVFLSRWWDSLICNKTSSDWWIDRRTRPSWIDAFLEWVESNEKTFGDHYNLTRTEVSEIYVLLCERHTEFLSDMNRAIKSIQKAKREATKAAKKQRAQARKIV